MKYGLYSQDKEEFILFIDSFNRETIKMAIFKHLNDYPTDILKYCKEYPKKEQKKYYDMELINLYRINPNNGKVSVIITKGGKTLHKTVK